MESSQNVVVRNLGEAHESSLDQPDQKAVDLREVRLSYATLKFIIFPQSTYST